MTASQLRTTVRVVLVFFFIVGFGVFAVGAHLWLIGHQSNQWPRVSGRLANVQFLGANAGRGASRIRVVYDYVAHGQSYHGDRICFGFVMPSERHRLAQMRSGDSVEVSYDSQDVSRSVLFPGTAGAGILLIAGIVVIIFFACVTFVISRNPPWRISDSEQAA